MLKLFPKNFSNLSVKISVFAILITLSMSVYGQRTLGRISLISGDPTKSISAATKSTGGDSNSLLAAAANIDQCANGSLASHSSCDGSGWVNGNVNQSKAHWAETESLVYRMQMTGLSTGAGNTHTLIIGYDILKGTNHAIDYLTSFDRTETTGAATTDHANLSNPCSGFPCTTGSPTSTFAIPTDNVTVTNKTNADTGVPVPQIPGVFTMWNGTITAVSYVTYAGGEERQVSITFTAASSSVLLSWGGHVAWQGEWGAGLSAGGISGSPYHMRLIDLDGSGGNQDRSLSASAVAIPAKLTIVKLVPFSLSVSVSFNFTGTGAGLSGFSLSPVTQSATLSSASTVFPLTTNLTGSLADQRQIQESLTPPAGWHVTALGCFNNGPNGAASIASVSSAAQISSGIAIATLAPVQADDIQCNFTNSIVTAANANITGRVTTRTGYGISGAMVSMQDATTGASVTVLTNPFGYYTISNVPVNDFCIVSVSSKRYTFSSNSLSFVLNDNLSGVNFVAN